jgi:hypothetical protein
MKQLFFFFLVAISFFPLKALDNQGTHPDIKSMNIYELIDYIKKLPSTTDNLEMVPLKSSDQSDHFEQNNNEESIDDFEFVNYPSNEEEDSLSEDEQRISSGTLQSPSSSPPATSDDSTSESSIGIGPKRMSISLK